MHLIADSGSSKTDWALIQTNGEVTNTETIGLNPFFHTQESITKEVSINQILTSYKNSITNISFFGAGCSDEVRNLIVKNGLSSVFLNAKIDVFHDIKAAVYATCGNQEGISCIVGTGSNCIYFDGQNTHSFTHALGHILGDEGSGNYIGKRIAREYINHELPEDIKNHIEKHLKLTKESVLEQIYTKPFANKYLASLAKPLYEIKQHPYIQDMFTDGFRLLSERHIEKIPHYSSIPVHFVGSIAYLYQDVLQNVAKERNFTIGKIIQKPIQDLVTYFKAK